MLGAVGIRRGCFVAARRWASRPNSELLALCENAGARSQVVSFRLSFEIMPYAQLRFRTFRRAGPQSTHSLQSGTRTHFPDSILCFRFSSATEPPGGGLDRNGTADAAGHDRMSQPCSNSRLSAERKGRLALPFSGAPIAAGLPGPAIEGQSRPGRTFCGSAGRFRSGLRWPTHTLLALRAPECERVVAPSFTRS